MQRTAVFEQNGEEGFSDDIPFEAIVGCAMSALGVKGFLRRKPQERLF